MSARAWAGARDSATLGRKKAHGDGRAGTERVRACAVSWGADLFMAGRATWAA